MSGKEKRKALVKIYAFLYHHIPILGSVQRDATTLQDFSSIKKI
jgi:hypothetical protein